MQKRKKENPFDKAVKAVTMGGKRMVQGVSEKMKTSKKNKR